jgi:peptide/nickel transport system permease protein
MRKPVYYAALAVLAGFVVLAVMAPWVAPYDPNAQDLLTRLKPYSATHWLGTDEYGRDQLSRLIFGARVSLLAAVEVVAVSFLIGVPAGVMAGFFPGFVDGALSRVSDALMSVPSLVLALTIVAVLGQGLASAMFAVGIVFAPRFFRVARASTYEVRQETFIEASFAIGCSWWRVAWRHVLPNAMSPLVVQIAVVLGAAITAEASLSFLGIGVQPPTASWGGMLASAYNNLYEAAFLIWAPGIAIAATVLAFTIIGDEARVALGTKQVVAA